MSGFVRLNVFVRFLCTRFGRPVLSSRVFVVIGTSRSSFGGGSIALNSYALIWSGSHVSIAGKFNAADFFAVNGMCFFLNLIVS